MNQSQKTENIYKTIMDRLINEIRDEVLSEGCNEDVLKELRYVSIINILIIYIIK